MDRSRTTTSYGRWATQLRRPDQRRPGWPRQRLHLERNDLRNDQVRRQHLDGNVQRRQIDLRCRRDLRNSAAGVFNLSSKALRCKRGVMKTRCWRRSVFPIVFSRGPTTFRESPEGAKGRSLVASAPGPTQTATSSLVSIVLFSQAPNGATVSRGPGALLIRRHSRRRGLLRQHKAIELFAFARKLPDSQRRTANVSDGQRVDF